MSAKINISYIKWKLLAFILALPVLSSSQVKISTDSTTIRIGEQIKYKIQVEADSTQLVVFPEGQTFMPLEAVEASDVDTVSKDNKRFLIREYSLTQFDSGSYTIPPQRLSISGRIILTDSLNVEVKGVEVDTTRQKLYDIKPMIAVDKSPSKWWLYVLIGLLVLALLGFLVYWFFIRKTRKDEEEIIHLEPYERAKLALKKLDEAQLLEKNEIKAYYSELTLIIRKYLDEKVYDRSLESTTQELIGRLRLLKDANKIDLDPVTIKNIETILRRADMVKFARSRPEKELAKMDRGTIDEEIDHVKESLPEPTEDELMEDLRYQEELALRNRRKRRFIIGTTAFVLLIGCYLGFGFHYGFRYVNDSILGHSTKKMLEKKEWIRSDYGAPPITISTPVVLERLENLVPEEMRGQFQVSSFGYGSLEEGWEINVTASKVNEESLVNEEGEKQSIDPNQITDQMLNKKEQAGVQNIFPKQDKFITPLGQEGIKTYGIADFPVSDDGEELMNANYALVVFATENIFYVIDLVWDSEDPYTEELTDKILKSIEITGLLEKQDAGGN